ncbi:MAG: septum formation initiator family protein [Roseiflexaceae bacterium]|nr:septum formation initiator family protein [Roseiflexaceae bacterium]
MARKRAHLSTRGLLQRLSRFGSPGIVVATIVVVVLSLWLLAGLVEQVLTGARQDRNVAAVELELATAEARNAKLGTAVASAKSPAYAEQVLREQLGYAREGDTVVLPSFPQVTPTVSSSPTPAPNAAPTQQANWRGWAGAFFPPGPTPTPIP